MLCSGGSSSALSDVSIIIAGSCGVLRETVDARGVVNGLFSSGVIGIVVSLSMSSMATPSSEDRSI